MTRLRGARITLAVTGGIAAYKSCELVRLLVRAGAKVRVAMTRSACEFITPLTLSTLSGSAVATDTFASDMPHLALTRECDLLVVVPATANILAKAAHGIADDLVSTLIAGRACPVAFAPAMNTAMWTNAATERNVATLLSDGAAILGPAAGDLACGVQGAGRMIEPADIVEHIERILTPKTLAGKRIVITAGPTFEAIDPVRGITNLSSGRQGWAIAQACARAGAEVTLVAGPTALPDPMGVAVQRVTSAAQMCEAVFLAAGQADAFIAVAAVADWRPEAVFEHKLKKEHLSGPVQLTLAPNADILAEVARVLPGLYTIGFALETENLVANARAKLVRKGANLIVANAAQTAIGAADNTVVFVTADGAESFETMPKTDVAERLVAHLAAAL